MKAEIIYLLVKNYCSHLQFKLYDYYIFNDFVFYFILVASPVLLRSLKDQLYQPGW